MRFVDWHPLVDDGFGDTAEFAQAKDDILQGISRITWPQGNDGFTINPVTHGNGVGPIKDAFIEYLTERGWVPEHERFDAHRSYPGNNPRPFAVEWETGNISSSHRAINRLGLGMLEERISGGVLIVPTKALYYLDRVVVAPQYRRRGVGTLIYDAAEERARARGRMALEVYVDPPNAPSLTFHERRGYGEVGRLVQANGKACSMLVKEL